MLLPFFPSVSTIFIVLWPKNNTVFYKFGSHFEKNTFLVALGLFAVAFASNGWEIPPEQIRDHFFTTGKRYNFKFDGQIASGLPISSSSDNSASRIESLVSLNFEDDLQVLFRINNIRVGFAQREVESREVQPFLLFEETELTEEQKESLLLPVRFRYENGLISEIEFDREEPTWSANIKRAILNMLQLNLSKRSRSDKEDRLMKDSKEDKEWETSTFFSTHEKTLEGDCETSYTVVPSGEDTLRVSKSINFEKCKKRVDIRYNLRFGEDCPTSSSKFNREEPNTISSTVFEFELNGNAKGNLIREVRLRSQYVFTPLDGEKQLMGTYVTNKLTLLSVESGVETIRGPKSEKKEELVYSTEWEEKMEKFRMTGEASLLKKSPFQWMEKKMELAEKFLTSLRHSIKSYGKDESLKSETVHEMARLIEILRVLTTHEIEKLEKQVKKDEKMTSIFYDCLSQAGTFPTVSRLVEGIISRRLSTVVTTKSLKSLLDVRTPSDNMIRELLRLTKEEVIIRSPIVRQSLWLSIGAVMNVVCGKTQERFAINREEMCTREQKEVYTREMEKLFSDSETHYDKILALKVFANSGIDLIVFPLEKIIKNRREEESVRLSAVEALRKLRNLMPRKVQNILLPLYKKTSESVEMRIAAFHHLMHTLPSRNIIDQITLQLEKEPSTRVFSYVFTTLKSFASSELPCEKDLSRDIEYSLRHVRRQSSRLIDSRSIVNSFYSKEFLSGAELIWSHIASNTSIIPSEVSASLSILMGGEWYSHMAEIGFSQENIHVLIEKLYELVKKNQNSIEEILVRGKRSSEMRPLEILKNLMKKMGIQERRSRSKHSAAVLYMRIKDMDYVFLPLEEKIIVEAIKEFITNGASDFSSVEKFLSRGYTFSGVIGSLVYEKTRIIATTFGMPLDITWKMPTLLSNEGVVKGSIEKRTLSLSVSPKLATTHVIHAECRSPILSQGVKLIHSLTLLTPIDMDIKLESESRSLLSFNFRLPETESVRVMRMQTRPVTYIGHESKKEEKFDHAVEKTIYLDNPSRKEISRVYGEEILGCRFAVRGNIHPGLFDKMEDGVSPIFIRENDIEMRMEMTEKTPREYSARLSFDSINKKMNMTEDIELDSFYPSEHSHFSVHSDESSEKSRRTEFKEYLRALSSSPVFTHRIHLSLEAIGSTKERRASGELRSMCDESLSYCKWTASIIRSPLLEGEHRDWELKSTLETLLPSRIVSVEEMKEHKHREVLARLTTKWGSDQKKTVTLRAQMDQSPEHIKLVERLLEKKNIDSVEQATRFNQIKISADYDLPLETITQFSRLSTLVKGLYPLEFEIETRDEKVEKEARLLAKLTVEPQPWRYANFSVGTPRETIRLKTIRLPFRSNWFSLEKKASIFRTFSPICEVSDSRMKTFDEIFYRAPLTTCYSILAQDCSEEPKFAVLLKLISKNGERKKLKMITRENTIEMEMKREEMEVTVDGKIIKEKKMNEFGLEKRGDIVFFENEDLFVKFDGLKAEIKMNKMYKAKQCGLCGHFDGEKKIEFRKADDEETEDLEEFHRSFLLKNDECEIEESRIINKENYEKIDYESELEELKTVEFVEKTQVIEMAHKRCFSKQPIPECPIFDKKKDTTDKKVHFTCLDSSSAEALRLHRESRHNGLSLDNLPDSFIEIITVPNTCNNVEPFVNWNCDIPFLDGNKMEDSISSYEDGLNIENNYDVEDNGMILFDDSEEEFSNYTGDAKKYTKQVETLLASGKSLLDVLLKSKSSYLSLLTAAIPVPDSDEQIAIKELHSYVKFQFSEWDNRWTILESLLATSMIEEGYSADVKKYLFTLDRLREDILNPKLSQRQLTKKRFISSCLMDSGRPDVILDNIHRLMVDKCPLRYEMNPSCPLSLAYHMFNITKQPFVALIDQVRRDTLNTGTLEMFCTNMTDPGADMDTLNEVTNDRVQKILDHLYQFAHFFGLRWKRAARKAVDWIIDNVQYTVEPKYFNSLSQSLSQELKTIEMNTEVSFQVLLFEKNSSHIATGVLSQFPINSLSLRHRKDLNIFIQRFHYDAKRWHRGAQWYEKNAYKIKDSFGRLDKSPSQYLNYYSNLGIIHRNSYHAVMLIMKYTWSWEEIAVSNSTVVFFGEPESTHTIHGEWKNLSSFDCYRFIRIQTDGYHAPVMAPDVAELCTKEIQRLKAGNITVPSSIYVPPVHTVLAKDKRLNVADAPKKFDIGIEPEIVRQYLMKVTDN